MTYTNPLPSALPSCSRSARQTTNTQKNDRQKCPSVVFSQYSLVAHVDFHEHFQQYFMANMNRDKTSGDIEAFKLALTCTLIKLALNSRSWPKPLSAILSGEIELGKNRTLKSDEQRRRSPLVEHSLVHRALVHGVDKLSAPVRTRRIMAPPSHKSRLIINNNSTIDQQQRQRLIINNSMHASTTTALIACMRVRSLPSGSALISAFSFPSFPPPLPLRAPPLESLIDCQ
jgi:hypothetical protein